MVCAVCGSGRSYVQSSLNIDLFFIFDILPLALIFNSLVKHPRSSLLLMVLYKSSYLQLQLQRVESSREVGEGLVC